MTITRPDNGQSPIVIASGALRGAVEFLLDGARHEGVALRLCGGLACWYHSRNGQRLAAVAGRAYSDMDFAAYYRDKQRVLQLLLAHGYKEDAASATVPGLRRTMFRHKAANTRGDVFYDAISFCHTIDLRDRLEQDYPTIPVADLLLQKMQIVQLTEKDALDVQMLLLDHEIRDSDDDTINAARIAQVCGSDWGFSRTLTLNVERIRDLTAVSPYLSNTERRCVVDQLARLREVVEQSPKSLGWHLRSVVGERMRWYETVDEH
jgi:hypothetical protein